MAFEVDDISRTYPCVYLESAKCLKESQCWWKVSFNFKDHGMVDW